MPLGQWLVATGSHNLKQVHSDFRPADNDDGDDSNKTITAPTPDHARRRAGVPDFWQDNAKSLPI